jgi:hypothetical protein
MWCKDVRIARMRRQERYERRQVYGGLAIACFAVFLLGLLD